MDMSTTVQQSQQKDFANQALPDLFHHTPAEFMFLLERDGTKFLRFYWDQVGKKLAQEQQISPFGLNFEIRQPLRSGKIALITLPKPHLEGEAYIEALIFRPYRVTTFLRVSDTTKVIALEYDFDSLGNERPLVVEWDKKLHREPLRSISEVSIEDFFTAVLEEIKY
jgi:hypothetical protein